jgi:hypothetical protein
MLTLAAALLLAPPATDTLLSCSTGAKRIEVTSDGTNLTYRFGKPGKPELTLTGNAKSGTVFYHRTLYARGEDQTLRFVSGDYSYVVFASYYAPDGGGAEISRAGVVILEGEREIGRAICKPDGDMREWPIFETLPKDEQNWTPTDLN